MLDVREPPDLKRFAAALAAALVLACSGGREHATLQPEASAGESALLFPQHLNVSAQIGTQSVFSVIALTVRQGSTSAELYAAVLNTGDIVACNPSFSVELRDADEQVVAAGISGLNITHFYRLTDDSGTVAGCVPPGAVSMVAIRDLSLDVPVEQVSDVIYRSSYWFLEVTPTAGVRLADVEPIARNNGVAYTGALVNELDVALTHPTVAVFPLNRVGRPLGVSYAGSTQALPPGGTWNFETSSSDAGVGYVAYPMGGP